jgi:transposase
LSGWSRSLARLSGEEGVVIGVEQWAEIRRLYFVEKRSKRAIHRLTGVHRDTITRALAAEAPPRYVRPPAGSKLDPYREWICEQLRTEPTIQSQRSRELASELGYTGGKSIFDEYVREVRPRFLVRRTFSARSIARASWCSAICGSRASRSRSGTGRRAAATW